MAIYLSATKFTEIHILTDKMESLATQCSSHSIGPANDLFAALIQALLAAQCALSPSDKWPTDYGPQALEKGIFKLTIKSYTLNIICN